MAVDPFLVQLAEICRTRRTTTKWVFVLSHAVGHTLGERLVLEGTNWANVRFVRPLDLALQVAAPFLVEREIDPAPDTLGPALIMRLLLELPGSTPPYFRPLAEQPQMADALWSTIRELRMAGVAAADLSRDAFLSPDKAIEFQALLSAYEAHLGDQRLADQASVFQEALRHLDRCPVLPEDVQVELPGVIWAPLERKFLDRLPGERLLPAAPRLPGLAAPRRLALLATPQAEAPAVPASDADRLAFLLAPDVAPPPKPDGTLSMFRAGGKEAEVEEVFRRIQADRLPFDHVEVACAAPEYTVLIWEKAQRYGWPVTVDPGIPITLTRPARALLAFCTWIADGFPAAGLRRLLQSGDMRLDLDDGPTAGQAARLLAESGATWGRQTYAGALTALAESYRERATDIEADEETRGRYTLRAAQVERLGTWIRGHLALVPEPDRDGRVGLGALLTACAGFVESTAARGSALDGAAVTALTGALDELGLLGGFSRPLGEAVAFIQDRIAGLLVGGDRARPGHLHVSSLIRAGYAGRPHTFVVGLEEGGVFPAPIEDPVLLDVERERLGSTLGLPLPTSRDRVSEALFAVISRLAALGGRVCLSFSCRDLRESRETFPSWVLLQALRLERPGEDVTYDHLNQALGEPVSLVPPRRELALGDAGWWLASLRGVGSAGRAAVSAAFPGLAQGEAAEAARDSEAFTIYDGFVREAGPRLDPRQSGRAVSASRLESLATCPFRYFLEHGLGIDPIEEAEADPDRWLDPLTRGLALHALYATFLREVRVTNEAPDPRRDLPRLRSLGEGKLAELRALIPPPSDSVYERERDEVLRDLDLFLRLEAEAPGRVPIGLEVSFGAGAAAGEPLAQADPVTLDLGTGLRFRLRGRIDRLDRLPDGSVEVVDYKTGRYWPDDWAGTFAGGRVLQHALYALAARQLLAARAPKARVTSSTYYFPTVRGQGQRVSRPQADPGAVGPVLRDLFDLLAGGTFLTTATDADCRYCEFQRACGGDPVARATRKRDNAANTILTAYRRLADHA